MQGLQPPADILLRLGNVESGPDDVPQGGKPLLRVVQRSSALAWRSDSPFSTSSLRQSGDSRSSRSLLASAEGDLPSSAAASSCVTPD